MTSQPTSDKTTFHFPYLRELRQGNVYRESLLIKAGVLRRTGKQEAITAYGTLSYLATVYNSGQL
jgi:hypothetical protein